MLSLARFERLAAAEWILYFCVAYLHKICISGTAMDLSDEAIALMERYAGAFPPLPVDSTCTGVWPRSAVVWDNILRFERLARSAPMDSRFLRRYSVMKADEWAMTLDPADGEVLTALEFSDRYKHLAYGARTGLQFEAERRGAGAGGRRADGRYSGRRDDRTDVLDMHISRVEFLAFNSSERRGILEQVNLSGSAMSLRDVFSACIAEYTYSRSQTGRADTSTCAGQGYQPSGSAHQTEGCPGYAYGNTDYHSGFDCGSSAPQEDPYARRR